MKMKKEYIDEYVKRKNLFPIETRIVIKYPKDKDFMSQGIIKDYCKSYNDFVWDYQILLDSGKTVYFDHSLVDKV